MAIIRKPNDQPLQQNAVLGVPAMMVPSYRVVRAAEHSAQFNILIKAHGGVGDVICSEPAIRYAVENFPPQSNISLLSPYPELFRHLKFTKIYNNSSPIEINLDNYLMFQTIDVTNELASEFVSHALMGGVDYASLNMWRLILPNHYKQVQLHPNEAEKRTAQHLLQPRDVVIHPGKTWKTRTFPKWWWDGVIKALLKGGARPVIIGGTVDNGRASTVDVDVEGCLDLRHKQTLMETVALLQQVKVLLTNDSSPIHMAATGDAWIGFVSTVKHPDHLTHWRKGGYGWRQQDLAVGGLYKGLSVAPNNSKNIHIDDAPTADVLSWLPSPEAFAGWALEKLEEK